MKIHRGPIFRLFRWLSRACVLLEGLSILLNMVKQAQAGQPTTSKIVVQLNDDPGGPHDVVTFWATADSDSPIVRLAAVCDERNRLRARVAELEKGEPW